MSKSNVELWESQFRRDAEADDLALFHDHLYKLGLPDEPEMLLHGTIMIVQACCAYSSLDGRKSDDLRFDYTEDELDFWFDDSFLEGSLFVTLQDVYDSIDEDGEGEAQK